jgi:hypothetical protein
MYNNNIPKPGDILKNSQSQMLANFQAIQTLISVNHGNFDSSVQGKHTFIQFPAQGGDPVTALGEVALYSKVGATSTVPELAFERQSNGDITVFTEGSNTGNTGYSRLPSGFLVKWGRATIGAAAGGTAFRTDTITINPIDPVYNTVYNVQLSLGIANNGVSPTSVSYILENSLLTNQFSVKTATTSFLIGIPQGWPAFTIDYFIIGI